MNTMACIGAILSSLALAVYAYTTMGQELIAFVLVILALFFVVAFFDAMDADMEWWKHR